MIPKGISTLQIDGRNGKLKINSNSLVFVASMYSSQNLAAITNLVKMFPDILAKVNDAQLFVIGGPTYLLGNTLLGQIEKTPNVFS